MTNFNFKYMGTFLRYKDSNGNQLDLNGSQVDTDLEERTEQNEIDIAALQHYFDSISVKESASGGIASFADGADNIPVKELVVTIVPIQDLHNMPYPYPAGGSNNLIPDGTDTSNGFVDNSYIVANGSISSSDDAYVSEYFAVTAGETYTYSATQQFNTPALVFYDADKNYISGVSAGNSLPKTVTAPDGAAFARCTQRKYGSRALFQVQVGSTATTPMYYSNICPISGITEVNIWHDATHDTSAEPTITFQLDNTIYGGTLDVINGILTVEKVMYDYDGSNDEEWGYNFSRFFISNPQKVSQTPISNRFRGETPRTYDSISDNALALTVSPYNYINFRKDDITSLAEWKAWLAANPVQLVMELVTPLEIQLSPHTINTLLGQNYFWSDGGNVAVSYVADTKLYIDVQTAASGNRVSVKETVNEIERPDVIEEKEVIDNIEEEKEI